MTTATDTAFSPSEIQTALSDLPGWEMDGNKLKKVYPNKNYVAALAFVQAVGELAEQQDHHPDIFLVWPTTTVWYWTHTANGITQKDVLAAQAVDNLASQ